MKNILLSSAIVFAGASAAIAGDSDFEANEFVTNIQSGHLELSVGTVDDELNSISTSILDVVTYKMGRFDTSLDLGLTYGRLDDTLAVSAEYNLSTALSQSITAYGSAEVEYITTTSDLDKGDTFVTPTVGAAYAFTDRVNAFGEVSYDWNASEDWEDQGGAFEVGTNIFVTDTISMTPSLIRTFDTDVEATNFKLETTLRF